MSNEQASQLLVPHWLIFCAIQISVIALPVIALDVLHLGADLIGYLSAAGRVPAVLFGLGIGAAVDRSDKRTLLLLGLAGSTVSTIALALLVNASALQFAALLGIALASGIVATVYDLSFAASVAAVADKAVRERLNHLNQTAVSAIQLAGPAVAGLLVAQVGAGNALFVNGFVGGLAGLMLGRLKPIGEFHPAPASGWWTSTVEGLRFCMRDAVILRMALSLGGNLLYSAVIGLVFLHAKVACAMPVPAIGLAISIGAGGFLLAPLALPHVRGRFRDASVHAAATCVTAAGWAIVAAAAVPAGTVAVAVLSLGLALTSSSAFANGVFMTSLRQQVTPTAMQGRVTAFLRSSSWLGMPLGAIAGGWIAHALGTSALFLLVAAAYLPLVLITASLHRAARASSNADAARLAAEPSRS